MANKTFDALVFSPKNSKESIVNSLVTTIASREKADPGNNYIAKVAHVYSEGENAGINYFVFGDSLKEQKGISSNLVEQSSKQSEIDEQKVIDLINENTSKIEINDEKLNQIVTEKLEGKSLEISDEKISKAVEDKLADSSMLTNLVKEEVAKNKTSLDVSDIIAFS